MADIAAPLIETRDLSKHYAGNLVLDAVDFQAWPGEVHAIVGANGAGKSTLMNILSGAVRPSSGEVLFGGEKGAFTDPAAALSVGVSCVYQELSTIPELDVARNIFLGREPKTLLGTIDIPQLYADTKELLGRYGLEIQPEAGVENLSVAQQQMVELARALSFNARILILDEPTSVLSISEKNNLFRIIRELTSHGLLIIYVSHFLGEVLEIADRVTVLRDGKRIDTLPAHSVSIDDLAQLITGDGEQRANIHRRDAVGSRSERLLINFESDGGPSEFEIAKGEIVGITGLLGSGRTRFARRIAGMNGPVSLADRKRTVRYRSVGRAIANGVVYVTEDRKKDGLFSELDLVANTIASVRRSVSGKLFRKPAAERAHARSSLKELRIVAASMDMAVGRLSGGNQQKVLMARAILTRPRLLICDEPTRGIDVAAKAQIHSLLRNLAAQGMAIIVISSENEELLSLASRIMVMRDGQFVARFDDEMPDEADLLLAMSGDSKKETLT